MHDSSISLNGVRGPGAWGHRVEVPVVSTVIQTVERRVEVPVHERTVEVVDRRVEVPHGPPVLPVPWRVDGGQNCFYFFPDIFFILN